MTPGTQILYHRISSGYRKRNLQRLQTEAPVVQFKVLFRILLGGTEKITKAFGQDIPYPISGPIPETWSS
jgi:hypothetical protein